MLTGYQFYKIKITGYYFLTLTPFDLTTKEFPFVARVEISSPNEKQILVKVCFKQVASVEDADSIGRLIATQVANRLAFEFKIAAENAVKGDSSFEVQVAGETVHRSFSNTIHFSGSGCFTHTINVADVPRLKIAIGASDPKKDTYYAQFRWIICQEDPVARFMHLYKILLSLEGGSKYTQKYVDDFIIGQEPGVQQIFNSHLNRNETIYTRLRNEVGHEIAGTNPATTRQGMEQYLDKLADHVKAAIANIC